MIEYIVGATTLVSFWMAGSGKWYGWAIMLINQAIWIYWTAAVLRSLPLLIVTGLITLVVIRNAVKGFDNLNPYKGHIILFPHSNDAYHIVKSKGGIITVERVPNDQS